MTTTLCTLITLLSLFSIALAKIQLLAQNFKVADGSIRNVKLIWTSDSKSEMFRVYRKSPNTKYKILATGSFRSYDDYDVSDGPHTYQVWSLGNPIEGSNLVTKNPPAVETLQGFKTYDNIHPTDIKLRSRIQLDDIFYEYRLVNDKNGTNEIKEFTSVDGFDFKEHQVVLARKEMCAASSSSLCKLESVSFNQNPKTLEVVMWAHWEEKDGYGKGRATVAFGRPGHGSWTFGGAFRPLGYDSRDLTFFPDDDGSGYVISSTHGNQDMNIYRLTPDWHNIKTLVATVLKGQAREAPAMIHKDGFYYLMNSRAAGWYPSTGRFISAPSMAGPWSENRVLGNLGGFSAQSGEVTQLGSAWVMRANKWSIPDIDPPGTPHRQAILVMSLSNGTATYAFYPKVLYKDGKDGGVYGVQTGRILSVGKRVASTGAVEGHPEYMATSGVNIKPERFYQPTSVPFIHAIDLGAVYNIKHIELTTFLNSGSESLTQFTVEGSVLAIGPYTPFIDQSKNNRVGFVAAPVSTEFHCRYVALKVSNVTNTHNKQKAPPGVHEFTVFGHTSAKSDQSAQLPQFP
ncbi:hypothetical protein PSTG_04851 [Puccinia striiformis f. sp. tritici PST-78]|uniref:Beta-xylosidase C-terminal Concanavalin A-like domain-containing protein n=1 Tax=Puccinia striiformis f. sp. tritici PST-78 TaxID=1165861 RepID=A0A0L0VRY4_9BASI|nr:hypothetical protein PSTG_04851 [Puccinia striiformis f. sp. tritici PST-78]